MDKQDVKYVMHCGKCIICTKEEYKNVRQWLHEISGEFIDSGDCFRAQIALNEVKRLDGVFL